MTKESTGYALGPGEALEQLDMGGDVLLLLVGIAQSDDSSVIGGVMHGVGPPLHVHDDEDEIVVVLDGELSYEVGEQRGIVSTGGLLWFPRTIPHTISNLSDRPCRFTVATPGGIEQLFEAQSEYFASLAPGAPPDVAEMERLPGPANRRSSARHLAKRRREIQPVWVEGGCAPRVRAAADRRGT